MMVRVLSFILLSFAFLAGCATSAPGPHRDTSSSHPATANPTSNQFANSLRLCRTHISNAPQANQHREITPYTPFIRVKGVAVARAPVRSCLSSGFGPRRGGAGRFHKGIDLYTDAPRTIVAAADGKVIQLGTQRGFGKTVLVQHKNGVQTRYAHLSSYAAGVKIGTSVRAGRKLGETGRTGNATAIHLHYEILVDGKPINPLN